MELCNKAWNAGRWKTQWQCNSCDDILLQMSPQLIRILHAYQVIPDPGEGLFKIHVLLGITWDQLRAAICPLREIVGNDPIQLQEIPFNFAQSRFLGKLDSSTFWLELAMGGMRLLGEMVHTGWHEPRWIIEGWGFWLRSCPPSSALLKALSDIGLIKNSEIYLLGRPEEIHNVLQWLKVTLRSLSSRSLDIYQCIQSS